MLMVVFGAGASWDSANFEPTDVTTKMHWRPPIGSDLFADRDYFGQFVDRYWWVRPLVNRFRGAKDSVTFEAELEEIQDGSKGRVRTKEQLLALRYYIQRVVSGTCQIWSNRIHGNTNYVRVVDDIDSMWTHGPGKDKPVIFATFNYDVLLDGALGQIGVEVGKRLESYTDHPQYKLIKPHGSVNWFHHVPVPNQDSHPYFLQIIPGLAKEELKASADFFIAPEQSDIDNIEGVPASRPCSATNFATSCADSVTLTAMSQSASTKGTGPPFFDGPVARSGGRRWALFSSAGTCPTRLRASWTDAAVFRGPCSRR